MRARARRYAPLGISLALIAGLGALGWREASGAAGEAEAVLRQDRQVLQEVVGAIADQQLAFAFAEAYDVARDPGWELTPGSEADLVRLRAHGERSDLLGHGAALLTPDRQVLVRVADHPGVPDGADESLDPLVLDALAGRPGLSSVTTIDRVPLVAVGVPIVRDERPQAVLALWFRADRGQLATYATRFRYGESGVGYVVDRNGGIVAAGRQERAGDRLDVPPQILRDIAAGRAGVTEMGGGGGPRRIVSFAPVGAGGWGAVTEQRASEFYGPTRSGQQRYKGALLFVLLIAGVVVAIHNHRRQAALLRISHHARFDPLTGLANRAQFLGRLTDALASARRDGRTVAVLFVDLDRFKVVNDSLGHDAGDLLLAAAGSRLHDCVRGRDLIARIGGDEFAVLIEDMRDPVEAEVVADRILNRLERPFILGEHTARVGVSIGIAASAGGADSPEGLLRSADLAMYLSKERVGSGYAWARPGLSRRASERLTIESDLRRALDQGQLRVHYQPEIDLRTGALVGVEALVRWDHPTRGLIPPAEFVPVAEETGLVVGLGRTVLTHACVQVRRWQLAHPGAARLRVNVNVSGVQLDRAGVFAEDVAATLAASGLDPDSLVLEITESVLIDHLDAVTDALARLRALGVGLAVDDFGTGSSSLSYLKHLPVSILKLDKSFVSGVGTDSTDEALVSSIVGMARALDLEVIAEGVEATEQIDGLQRLGCHRAQGYLFAPPMPPADLERMLVEQAAIVMPVIPRRRVADAG